MINSVELSENYYFIFRKKKHTKISLLMKFVLLFVKKRYQIDQCEGNTMVYKYFMGSFFVIKFMYKN